MLEEQQNQIGYEELMFDQSDTQFDYTSFINTSNIEVGPNYECADHLSSGLSSTEPSDNVCAEIPDINLDREYNSGKYHMKWPIIKDLLLVLVALWDMHWGM